MHSSLKCIFFVCSKQDWPSLSEVFLADDPLIQKHCDLLGIFLTQVSWLQNTLTGRGMEWGRWAGKAFIKWKSHKLPSYVHLSTDLTLVVPPGAGERRGFRAAQGDICSFVWCWCCLGMGGCSGVRRRENSYECDKLQIVFLQDSFC